MEIIHPPHPLSVSNAALFSPSDPCPDAPVAELHDLFCKKLQQCCVMFDFLDCVADLKGKEIKRAALNELVESVATSRGVLIEPLYPEAIKMVRGRGGGKYRRIAVITLPEESWSGMNPPHVSALG